MTAVDAFCIDVYEAFLVEIVAGQEAAWSPFLNPGAREVRAKSAPDAIPQGHISEVTAGAACANAGKRLCTSSEWLRACHGPDDFTYPYGDAQIADTCNDHRATHPAVDLYGANDPFSHLNDSCLNQLPDTVDASGANDGCVSAEGVFDLVGNLHEWIDEPAGTFRGGFFLDTQLNGPGCNYATTAHTADYFDYSTGFRCCADP
jgi:formylglycine-generating enzyme required for sulfatase activity